jgi:proline dehydrogenase
MIRLPVIRDLAWRFVAGQTFDAALATIASLRAEGFDTTINYIGTHVVSESATAAATDAIVASVEELDRRGLPGHLSVKLTQIGLDLDEELARRNLRRILDACRPTARFVRVDMEERRYLDPILRLVDDARADYGNANVGVALQSYLRGRGGDVERLARDHVRIRLVKGGYWEPEAVTMPPAETDAAFRDHIGNLLRAAEDPAIATHDPAMIRLARDLAATIGRDPGSYEFQMLFGVGTPLAKRLVASGHRVRIYVPYGPDWYPYVLGCLRRATLGAIPGRRRRRAARATGRGA